MKTTEQSQLGRCNMRPDANHLKTMEQLLEHVVRASMDCNNPTIASIAVRTGICEDCCSEILLVAQRLGLVEHEPCE